MNNLPGWAVRHPGLAVTAKITLCAVLLFLVSFEGVVLAQQPSRPHAIVWAAGIIVCLCVVPYTRVPLVPRACVAVAVSWTASIILMVGEHPEVTWGLGEGMGLLVLLAAVVQRCPARTAAVLGPMLGVACVTAPMRDVSPGAFTVLYGVLTVLVTAYSLIQRQQAGQRVNDLAAVRSAERLELARELHDLVAHHVTGIAVQARAARYTGVSGEQADATFARIETSSGEALAAMRRLVRVLREGAAETTPVAGIVEVRELAEAFSEVGPPVVLYVERGLDERIPSDVAAGVHRIVREALTNIRKHAADATAVRIGLRSVPAGLELRITDDGTGAARLSAQAFGGGYGLVGLQERAEALGGELTAGPAPEGGWQILATLSLDA